MSAGHIVDTAVDGTLVASRLGTPPQSDVKRGSCVRLQKQPRDDKKCKLGEGLLPKSWHRVESPKAASAARDAAVESTVDGGGSGVST